MTECDRPITIPIPASRVFPGKLVMSFAPAKSAGMPKTCPKIFSSINQ